MKKNLTILFELVAFIVIIVILGVYLNEIYASIRDYSVTQGLPIEGVILYKTLLFVLPLIILITVLRWIVKKQKEQGIKGLFILTSEYFRPRKLLTLFMCFILVLILLSYVVIVFQDLFIYFPNYAPGTEMRIEESNRYEKINILSLDGKQYDGWAYIDESHTHTILYFGGNAQSSAMFFSEHDALNWDSFNGFNVIMVDYPGYGLSNGKPNETSIYEMSLIVYDYVSTLNHVDSNKIIVMGFSLGTGVASYVASQRDIYKLILVAPFTSIVDVVNLRIPIFYGPFEELIRSKYKTIDRIKTFDVDTLVIYSLQDEVISADLSKKVVELLLNVETIVLQQFKHNEILGNQELFEEINQFVIG